MKAYIITGLLMSTIAGTATAHDKTDVAGSLSSVQWVNEENSVLTITQVEDDGQFVGTYVNGETTKFPCATATDIFQVEGQLSPDSSGSGTGIAFAVNWTNSNTNCGSVTRWAGALNLDDLQITTQWVLATDGSAASLLGADVFTAK